MDTVTIYIEGGEMICETRIGNMKIACVRTKDKTIWLQEINKKIDLIVGLEKGRTYAPIVGKY